MPDFITLSCPSCGGKLEITPDIERFACGYCGNEHLVKRGGGIISIIPIAEDIKGIKTGVDKTAAELAIVRLEKEISELKQRLPSVQSLRKKYGDKTFGVIVQITILLDKLLDKKYGKKFTAWTSYETKAQVYRDRILALTVEDIDYLTKDGYNSLNPKQQNLKEIIEFLDDLNSLKFFMENNENIISSKEAELSRLKQLVSS